MKERWRWAQMGAYYDRYDQGKSLPRFRRVLVEFLFGLRDELRARLCKHRNMVDESYCTPNTGGMFMRCEDCGQSWGQVLY